MPLIGKSTTNEEQNQVAGTNFGYSAAKIEHLEEVGATDYTLATINVDVSASVWPFRNEMELAIHAAVSSWKKHPRSEYLLVRFVTFNDEVTEEHGFRLLADCDPDSYIGSLDPSGMTALYKADTDVVKASLDYAQRLVQKFFLVNSITITITDGRDNRSAGAGIHAMDVKDGIAAALRSEALESHVGILIGVAVTDPEVKRYLAEYKEDAGFDQYVELPDADPDTLARLGNFMAASVSSQSDALGTGGPSKPLNF